MANPQSEAPVIVQAWNAESRVVIRPRSANLFRGSPRVGMVVGTYAAVPYIHLQLEARRRFYPGVPLLLHDDGSHRIAELAGLCRQYGCDFEYNDRRLPPCVGDLSAFVGGLLWAARRDLDILVKVSRRWLFLVDWERSLKALGAQSQYATFCSYTTAFQFGFRTECVGLAVAVWLNGDFLEDAKKRINEGKSVFVEGYVHEFARRYEAQNCEAAESWREAHPMSDDRNGYALWTLLGTDRCERSPNFLWHDSCGPEDYLAVSRDWGLPYTLEDFIDPNQGAGTGL
jgi:hypothetical protein